MQPRRPSQVRARILEEHARLRILFSDLDDVAKRVLAGEALLAFRLRVLAEALRERFLEHLDLEDEVLVPALREIGGSGPERAQHVSEDHQEQRRRFQGLLCALREEGRPVRAMAADLRTLVADLLQEMMEEERSVLDADLFRDDFVEVESR